MSPLIIGVFALDIEEGLLKHSLLQAQMDASHCFVLTKADLLPERDALNKLKPFLEWQKPTFLAKEGYVEEDIESLFGQVQEKPRGSGKHQSFESYTLRLKGFYSKLEVEEFFRKLPRNVYRAKGIIYFVSGETLSFEGFSDIKKFCEDLKNSHFKRLVLLKVPSGVVSYLLPKAHLSLQVDTKEKEETILSLLKLVGKSK